MSKINYVVLIIVRIQFITDLGFYHHIRQRKMNNYYLIIFR